MVASRMWLLQWLLQVSVLFIDGRFRTDYNAVYLIIMLKRVATHQVLLFDDFHRIPFDCPSCINCHVFIFPFSRYL